MFLDELQDEKTGDTYYQINDQSYLLELLEKLEK